ncbi:uncharacterized protein PAF06_016278 [Gastrophryne carolinensis]
MQKSILSVMLLHLVVFCLLHYAQGAPKCAKCPETMKWSECVNCDSFCPSDTCKLPCTPGCVCASDKERMIGYSCFPEDACGMVQVDPIPCPEGAIHNSVCRNCNDFCPGHLKKEQCDCTKCVWGCKCLDEKLVIDTVAKKCVPPKQCSSAPKPQV